MPPKFKFTKAQIVDAGFAIVRRRGWSALTARSVADALGASARPIYSFFSSMEALDETIVKRAVDLLYDHMTRRRTGEIWIDHGIGYVMFAHDEKHLFKGINDERHIDAFKRYGDLIWKTLTASLDAYPPFAGLSAEQIHRVQLTRWLYAHGLAFQVSNPTLDVWDEDKIIDMMETGSRAILEGLKASFAAAIA